jgi:hypothetical protein
MKQIKHPLPWTAGKHANKKSWYVYDDNKVIVASFNTEEQAVSCAKLANSKNTVHKGYDKNKQYIEYIMYYGMGFTFVVLAIAAIFFS